MIKTIKIILSLMTIILIPQANAKIYSLENPYSYPELVEEKITKDMLKPDSDFKTIVLIDKKDFTDKFKSQLIEDNVIFKTFEEKGLLKISLDYSKSIKTTRSYNNVYFYILGIKIDKYIQSTKCNINKSEDREELWNKLSRQSKYGYLNFTSPNLVHFKNIDEALTLASDYCNSKFKDYSELSFSEKLKDFFGFLKITDKVKIVSGNRLSLSELMKF